MPNVCWKESTAGHKRSSTFLELTVENVMSLVIEELDLILANKEELVVDVKVSGSLGCSDHAVFELREEGDM